MSQADRRRDQPRAMIHRRILDVASSDPEASLAAIAEEVSGASPSLVERVLDEYGDPGRDTDTETDQSMPTKNASTQPADPPTDETPDASDDAGSTDAATDPDSAGSDGSTGDSEPGQAEAAAERGDEAEAERVPASESLSEKQRRTLRAVYERPDASQGDLAEELDVTRATVRRRLNAIPGFGWTDRTAVAEAVFGDAGDDEPGSPTTDEASEPATDPEGDSSAPAATDGAAPGEAAASSDPETGATSDRGAEAPRNGRGPDPADGSEDGETATDAAVDRIEATLAELDERVADLETTERRTDRGSAPLPPELAHKVVHACMESDRLTEDEELDVLRAFMAE